MADPARVLVVDDSILFRTKLRMSLSEDPALTVVGSAMDPEDAMRKIEQLKPDVITLDVEMPKMNGIEFLKKLMPQKPIPVIVVTSLPMNALDALEAGAVDFVNKPQAGEPGAVDEFLLNLRNKVNGRSVVESVAQGQSVGPLPVLGAGAVRVDIQREASLGNRLALGAPIIRHDGVGFQFGRQVPPAGITLRQRAEFYQFFLLASNVRLLPSLPHGGAGGFDLGKA